MIAKIIVAGGLGKAAQVLQLPVTQVILYREDGTPLACAAEYGMDGSVAVASAGWDVAEFHRMLRNLGEHRTVVVSTLQMPRPAPGARLVAGPGVPPTDA